MYIFFFFAHSMPAFSFSFFFFFVPSFLRCVLPFKCVNNGGFCFCFFFWKM